MEGTDTHILDGNLSHDHTFYGNGCENEWKNTPPDYNGSGKSCSTRIVQTKDSENQKNGTYYNFQAATSGVGSTLSTDNANSDDTFCPLGWQLPYSGTGGDYYNKTRSWKFIFGKYTIQSNSSGATKLMSYPISYVSSGNFNWSSGGLFSQGVLGLYWSSTSISSTNTYRMVHSASSINDSDSGFRALGQAVRCILEISIPKGLPWHPGNCSYMHISTGNIARRALA